MSGPKVVRVVTREELEANARGELAIVDSALEKLRVTYQRYSGIPDEVEKDLLARRENLESLLNAGKLTEVIRQAPLVAQFLRAEVDSTEKAAILAAEAMRQKRRRLSDAATTLAAALKTNGRIVASELTAIIKAAKIVSEGELSGLQGVVDSHFKDYLAVMSAQATQVSALGHDLAARLSIGQEARSLTAWLAERPQVSDPNGARIDSAVAAIEALGSQELLQEFAGRADELDKYPSEQRAALVDKFIVDAARAARSLKQNAVIQGQLAEMCSALMQAGTLATQSVAAEISRAISMSDLRNAERLISDAGVALRDATTQLAAVARRKAILVGLSALGYEVRQGMETSWARDGRIVLKKPDANDYGVELGAPGDASRMQVRIVGSNQPTVSRSPSRDREQETVWCNEFQQLQSLMSKNGNEVVIEKMIGIGIQPVKSVAMVSEPEADIQKTVFRSL